MMQQIQLTRGCPNNCAYCYEPKEMEYFHLPVIKDNEVQILDMNFLANPKVKDHIKWLGEQRINNKVVRYELICGIDYRLMDQETADLLFKNRFIKVRWAWDYQFGLQYQMRDVFKMFVKAGYKPNSLSVFILVNWKIPYVDCVKKLDLLKVWNVKVNDCCWDGGYKLAKPVFWKPEHIKNFRAMCRKHNQLVNFKIDPEHK